MNDDFDEALPRLRPEAQLKLVKAFVRAKLDPNAYPAANRRLTMRAIDALSRIELSRGSSRDLARDLHRKLAELSTHLKSDRQQPSTAVPTGEGNAVHDLNPQRSLDSGAKRNGLKRSGFERPFQVRQSRLGRAS
jgi:hypothetical protein